MLLLLWALWSLPPDTAAASLPLVVLPPFFRPNATNSIVVAAAKSKYDVVDIHIEIRSFKGNEASVVLVEKLRSKKAGESSINENVWFPSESIKSKTSRN
ncbi:unnamed protein product [Nippostrongylus brasiliensis]|uniref:Secreted protein n=1 Tax=Nippostrongylus brasiliensis TaxID=27835 RepID=A0A0N4YYW3_NIPBR|nr:unnamed protein product [Nippostrongylus brasiliensis]